VEKLGFEMNYETLPDGRFKQVIKRFEAIGFTEKESGVVVNGLPIFFDFKRKHIGVMFSGGVDSTMLLYILCRIIREFKLDIKITPVTVSRHWETTLHNEVAKDRIFAYIDGKFPGILRDLQWGFLPGVYENTPIQALTLKDKGDDSLKLAEGGHADLYYFAKFHNWIARVHGLEIIYCGSTTNPPQEFAVDGPGFRAPEQSPVDSIDLQDLQRKINYHGKHHCLLADPFLYIEKTWITAQYKNFAVEDLYEMTQSCVSAPNGCKDCFSCYERKWGLDMCDIYLSKHATKRS
jgi:hypothetical protein